MAKAINWPLAFREEVMNEGCEQTFLAVRLGELYFNNQYWVADEVVDIRVNHKVIRKGIVIGDLRQLPLAELSADDYHMLKSSLRNIEALQSYLSQTYQTPVTEETLLTLITYRNYPIVPEEMEVEDDPHQ